MVVNRCFAIIRYSVVVISFFSLWNGIACAPTEESWTDDEVRGARFFNHLLSGVQKPVVKNVFAAMLRARACLAPGEDKSAVVDRSAKQGGLRIVLPQKTDDGKLGQTPNVKSLRQSLVRQGFGSLLKLVGNKLFWAVGHRDKKSLSVGGFCADAGRAVAGTASVVGGAIYVTRGREKLKDDPIIFEVGSLATPENKQRLTDTVTVTVSPRKLGIQGLKKVQADVTLPMSGQKLSGNIAAVVATKDFSAVPKNIRPDEIKGKISSNEKPEFSSTWNFAVGKNVQIKPTVGVENVSSNDGCGKKSTAYVHLCFSFLKNFWPSWLGRARPALTRLESNAVFALSKKREVQSSASISATWDEETVGAGRPHVRADVSAALSSNHRVQNVTAGLCLLFKKQALNVPSIGTMFPQVGVKHTFGPDGNTELSFGISSDDGAGITSPLVVQNKSIKNVLDKKKLSERFLFIPDITAENFGNI